MKTIEDIKNEIAKENGYTGSTDVFEFSYALCDEVTKRYATEAIKADREMVAKRATISVRVNINGQRHPVVNPESILNLPIELK